LFVTSQFANIVKKEIQIIFLLFIFKRLDAKGKNKQAYLLSLPNNETFGVARIWSPYKHNNQLIYTFALITTPAQGIMCEIHNSKQRMPLILTPETEKT